MNMSRIAFILVAAAIIASAIPATSFAQQSNFSVTPPPIASPTFTDGEGEFKIRGTIVSISGPDVSIGGAGADMVARKAFSNEFAGDVQFGIFGMGGDIGTESITMSLMSFGANLELQPFKSDDLSMIIFTGLIASVGVMTADSFDATTTLSGVQVGLQFGIKAGDFHIDPFFMSTSQSGSATISSSMGDYTADIEPFTTTSFGLDILYIPANITLSSIFQEAADQGTDSGYDTTIIQFAWSTKF